MSVLELEQEHVERDEPPKIGHISDDPARKIALCGTRLRGYVIREPVQLCIVCFFIFTEPAVRPPRSPA